MEASSQRVPQLPYPDSPAKLKLGGVPSPYNSTYKNGHAHFPAQFWVFPRATSGNTAPTSREHGNGIANVPDSVGQNAHMGWDCSLQMVPGNNATEEHLDNIDSDTWNPRGQYVVQNESSTRPVETPTSDSEGADSLQKATHRGHTTVVELLLNSGADVKVKNSRGEIALHLAAKRGHQDIVKLLLAKFPLLVREADNNGQISLHLATRNGYRNVVGMLLNVNSNANINTYDFRGQSALHVAAAAGQADVGQLLLERVIGINLRTCNGLTALHVAADYGQDAMATLLLEYGADPDAKSNKS